VSGIEPPSPEARRIIAAAGGGFLRNTIRLDGQTCAVCTTPIQPCYSVCYQCWRHQQSGQRLADLVVPLVYGIANAQSGWLMHNYKGVAPGPTDRPRLKLLLALALTLHRRCVEGANGELGFYLVSDGTGTPYRVRIRPPCFQVVGGLSKLLEGRMLADIVPTFGSLNMIGGECDH